MCRSSLGFKVLALEPAQRSPLLKPDFTIAAAVQRPADERWRGRWLELGKRIPAERTPGSDQHRPTR